MLYGLATGLAEALTAIHAAGIVHRDLKPSNVLLTAGGPKVIDFGIAQALDTTSLTRTGITVGSAGFMAPEQVMGKAWTPADIFTWGVTVAYAASGQSPFGTGTSDAIMYRIVHAAPDLSAVPPGLRPLVEAALAKEPRDRPTAPQLLSELTHTAAQPSVGSGNPTQTILAQTWHSSAPGPTGPLRDPAGPPSGSAPLRHGPGHRAAARSCSRSCSPWRSCWPPRVPRSVWRWPGGPAARPRPRAPARRRSARRRSPRPTRPSPRRRRPPPRPRAPEPGHHESGHHEPGYHEPGHHEPGDHAPGHHQPGHHEPSHHEPGHHEPGYHEPGHHEPASTGA